MLTFIDLRVPRYDFFFFNSKLVNTRFIGTYRHQDAIALENTPGVKAIRPVRSFKTPE